MNRLRTRDRTAVTRFGGLLSTVEQPANKAGFGSNDRMNVPISVLDVTRLSETEQGGPGVKGER